MWQLNPDDEPDDFVIATGEAHSVLVLRGRLRRSGNSTGGKYVPGDPRDQRRR